MRVDEVELLLLLRRLLRLLLLRVRLCGHERVGVHVRHLRLCLSLGLCARLGLHLLRLLRLLHLLGLLGLLLGRLDLRLLLLLLRLRLRL